MRTMARANPSPPEGKYPQFLLCDHLGSAPKSAKIKNTINMVPSMFCSFCPATREAPWLRKACSSKLPSAYVPTRIREKE